jgi:hypothetical protein
MNLSGSFWANAFGSHLGNQASPIDAILERSDFSLMDLLVEDDIIQECKALNDPLIKLYVWVLFDASVPMCLI